MTERAALHEHALDNIRYIRDAMERASAFTSIPGWGGFSIGVTAIITSAVAARYAVQPRMWLTTWLIEAVVAMVIAAITMTVKMRRASVTFTAAPSRRFFVSYSAPLIAAAFITFTLVRAGIFAP